MRGLSHLLIVVVATVSTVAITMPVRSQTKPLPKTSCCAHMAKQSDSDGCGDESLNSQDRQCCSACATCLALFSVATGLLIFPPHEGQALSVAASRALLRAQRPPVPPPRVAFS